MCEWRVLRNGTVIGVSPARNGPALIWRGGCQGMPCDPAELANPLWAAAEVLTTYDRPQDNPHDSPHESARPGSGAARRQRGPWRTVPGALDRRRRKGLVAVPWKPQVEAYVRLTCGG